jgi:hypothetical protein
MPSSAGTSRLLLPVLVTIFVFTSSMVPVHGDFFSELVASPSPIHGLQVKEGVLPPLHSSAKFSDKKAQSCIKKKNRDGDQAETGPCPMAKRCGVFINHK